MYISICNQKFVDMCNGKTFLTKCLMFNDDKKQVEQHKFRENLGFTTYLWKIRKK